jgi:hypothetical protein
LGGTVAIVASSPMRDGVEPNPGRPFDVLRENLRRAWREKLGPRRITVGDCEVGDTVEAQIALTLVNAARTAFKPGPRNYDSAWIRDGSAQALALLFGGLIEEGRALRSLVLRAHLREWLGLADPQRGRHGQPTIDQQRGGTMSRPSAIGTTFSR